MSRNCVFLSKIVIVSILENFDTGLPKNRKTSFFPLSLGVFLALCPLQFQFMSSISRRQRGETKERAKEKDTRKKGIKREVGRIAETRQRDRVWVSEKEKGLIPIGMRKREDVEKLLKGLFPEIYVTACRYALCGPTGFNKLRAAVAKNVLTSNTALFLEGHQ